jgi:succinyl-CoA synthetase beta subunit
MTFRIGTSIRRCLSLLEHESYGLLSTRGIKVPSFYVINRPEDKVPLQGRVVIKAQVLAGGRGKGRFIGGHGSGIVVTTSEYIPLDI